MQLLKDSLSSRQRDNNACSPHDAPIKAGELESTRGVRLQLGVTIVWPALLDVLKDSGQLYVLLRPHSDVTGSNWRLIQMFC